MSDSLLAQRLRKLEEVGVIQRMQGRFADAAEGERNRRS